MNSIKKHFQRTVGNRTALYWTSLELALTLLLWFGSMEQTTEAWTQANLTKNNYEASYGSELSISPDKLQPAEPARIAGIVGKKPRSVKISCYSSVESKGKNGTNPWSAATYLYPIGTRIFIEGIGERIVETRTSRAYSDRIDVYFGDAYEDCLNFGVQTRNVRVL